MEKQISKFFYARPIPLNAFTFTNIFCRRFSCHIFILFLKVSCFKGFFFSMWGFFHGGADASQDSRGKEGAYLFLTTTSSHSQTLTLTFICSYASRSYVTSLVGGGEFRVKNATLYYSFFFRHFFVV